MINFEYKLGRLALMSGVALGGWKSEAGSSISNDPAPLFLFQTFGLACTINKASGYLEGTREREVKLGYGRGYLLSSTDVRIGCIP